MLYGSLLRLVVKVIKAPSVIRCFIYLIAPAFILIRFNLRVLFSAFSLPAVRLFFVNQDYSKLLHKQCSLLNEGLLYVFRDVEFALPFGILMKNGGDIWD